jgi:glycogen phosphorylase
MRANGYRPQDYYQRNPELKLALDRIASGFFSHGDTEVFKPLLDTLMHHDPYFLLADYQSYIDCQREVGLAFRDIPRWTRMSILNTARTGTFSSDRAIQEYCDDIWHIKPVKVAQPDIDVLVEGDRP